MIPPAFERARDAARSLHDLHPVLDAFAEWPGSVDYVDRAPNPIAATTDFPADRALAGPPEHEPIRDAFAAIAPTAKWRETYCDADIGEGFNARFGCYELIGRNGHFVSENYGGFIVYVRPGIWYPWHDHPAEEMYLVIAGEAEFLAEGRAPQVLGPGGAATHASMQPHALRTHDGPVLCYVAWRGDMTATPKLTADAP